MAITFQQGMANGAANAGPVTTTFDATPAAGDLILVFYVCASASDKAPVLTTGGYTDVGSSEQYANGTSDTNSKGFYKYSDGTETNVVGADMAGTADGVSLVAMVFRGVASAAQGGPFSTTPTLASGTTNGNADNAQIATAAGDAVVLMAGAAAATIGTFTAPANYTTNAELGVAGVDTFDAMAAMAYRLSGYGNPENPAAWAMSGTSHSYTAITLALKAAPSVVTLVVQEAAIALAADGPFALTQHNILAVAEARMLLAADNIVLEGVPITLVVQDALIALAADGVALTQHNVLAVQEAAIALAADGLALTQHNVLSVQEAVIALAADNLDLVTEGGGEGDDEAPGGSRMIMMRGG